MTALTDEEEDAALAAEHVLGLLEPAEAVAFERRLGVDPAFRDLVAAWTEHLAGLAAAIPAVPPPAAVEAALMRRLFPAEHRPWWHRLRLPMALAGGLAALVVLWTVNLGLLTPQPAGPAFEARIAAEDASLVVLAQFDPATGLLVLHREAGTVSPGRSQHLWLIAGEAAPVSLGVLPTEAEATVAVDERLAASLDGGVLAISDEPPGGSPLAGPSGAVLALGPVTRL